MVREQKIHYLKTWPEYFWAVTQGHKTFEVRYNDRDFQEGDVLVLYEYVKPDPSLSGIDLNCGAGYTGRFCHMGITYVLSGPFQGLQEGYVVLGLSEDVWGFMFERAIKAKPERRLTGGQLTYAELADRVKRYRELLSRVVHKYEAEWGETIEEIRAEIE